MIRTETVNLTVIPAIAYRQKLTAGGAGIVILRSDCSQPGIASISKTSGKPIPAANLPADYYPAEALEEAIKLTSGMPYRKRSAPSAPEAAPIVPEEPETPKIRALEVVVDSSEYQKVVDAYTDKNGKLSYALLNKDLIRFVHRSSVCRKMISEKAKPAEIRLYATGTKFRDLTGNRKLTDDQVKKIGELLDEVSPKGVFRELNDELKRMLAK